MTIGVLGFGNLAYLPFLYKYTDVLDAVGATYDVVYWDREGLEEEAHGHARQLLVYRKRSAIRRGFLGKMIDFAGYRRFVERLLREQRYDRLIVLTTMPGVLLARTLERDFSKRYVFDVRDYAYEHVPFFFAAERRVVRHAALCMASSPGYRSWLPAANWKISHNVNGRRLRAWLAQPPPQPEHLFRGPVRVLRFVGRTRSPGEVRAVIDQLGGHPVYEVHYHGDDVLAWDAAAYARARSATNVHFHGRYRPEERWSFYRDCDLVLSSYDARLPGRATLLTNKLYDAAMAQRPLLVSPDTYLAEVVQRHGLGFAVDARREPLGDAIERFAQGFEAPRFAAGCRAFLTEVARDEAAFEAEIREFARG